MADAFLQELKTRVAGRGALSGPPLGGPSLGGLPLGAAAWALARLAPRSGPPLLVVIDTAARARALSGDLRVHAREVPVSLLPADDVRPWDGLSPHPDRPRQRILAIDHLRSGSLGAGRGGVVVAPAQSLLQRVLSAEGLDALTLRLSVGQEIAREALVQSLVERGYLVVPACDAPGTVSRRGEVVVVWPTGAVGPARVELFDDEIEEISALDPETLRATLRLPELRILPAREAAVTPGALIRAARHMAQAVDRRSGGQALRRRVLEDLRAGLWFPAAEDYLCALHPLVPLTALAGDVAVIEPAAVGAELRRHTELIASRWSTLDDDQRPLVLPEARFCAPDELAPALESARHLGEVLITDADVITFDARDNAPLKVGGGALGPLVARLRGWLDDGWQVVLAAEGRLRADRLLGLLTPHGLAPVARPAGDWPAPGELALWRAPLTHGFHAPRSQMALLTAGELFGQRRQAARRRTLRDAVVSSLSQLAAGDLVVHRRHGIGRFMGLRRLTTPVGGRELEQDFVELAYRGDDRMYLPVTRLDQLWRYRAVGDRPARLDKLGGVSWERRRTRVRDKVAALAGELLRTHARREVAAGRSYPGLPAMYQQFAETFEFEETPDQEAAIADVLADLAAERPMDRLLIGDVGFGKTEVAARAAMRVVAGGHQVALLCPTTVLAFQHARTLAERFAETPVVVEHLSRFRTAAQTRQVRKSVSEGGVDILIGTHTLLSRKLRFRSLGLVVIDEEHRFGVAQKARLRRLAEGTAAPCEVLSMSATPIPRTLHMALSGTRPVSVIATPPPGRQSIATQLIPWNDARVQDDIRAEIRRGGQVFFVHDRVQSIVELAQTLRDLVPEARFGVAHGQMAPERLEQVLVEFVRGDFHVLVCTTIIDSGIDMRGVNTIFINRAQSFGLAQLYQLRGRVGRGSVRGRCVLLVPRDMKLRKPAMRRLRVLQENTELGSGFAVASADMEIRGAGDLLGRSQHGHIQSIGFDAYVEVLEEAIAAARGDLTRSRLDPELEIPVPALIPEAYMETPEERLVAYRALALAATAADIRALVGRWERSLGEPPQPVLNLAWKTEVRLRCRELGILRLHWLKVRVILEFHGTTTVPPARIARLVTEQRQRFSLVARSEGRRLAVRFTPVEGETPFRFLHWVLRQIEVD